MSSIKTTEDNIQFYPINGSEPVRLPSNTSMLAIADFKRVRLENNSEGFVETLKTIPVSGGSSLHNSTSPSKSISSRIEIYEASQFIGETVKADIDFHIFLDTLNIFAMDSGLKIYVTHSFRKRDIVLNETIVPKAKRSNHLVGHAIDMNLILGNQWFNSRKLKKDNLHALPAEVNDFITKIREQDYLRWGGDFTREDPVHIDDNLYWRNPELWEEKFIQFNQV